MTPEIWRIEYIVQDAAGEDVDWLSSRTEALAMADCIGGKVVKVTEYLTDREEIFDATASDEDDDE